MSGADTDGRDERFACVVREDGHWRIARFWSDDEARQWAPRPQIVPDPVLDGTVGFALRNVRARHVAAVLIGLALVAAGFVALLR